jgi:tyrosyl-tRNA synthetase
MARYYPLLLGRDLPSELHPLEAKKQLASEMTGIYHTPAAAQKTLNDWNQRFSEKKLAEADLPEFVASDAATDSVALVVEVYEKSFGANKSRADARRLITQGSVQIDGAKITDPKARLNLKPGQVLRLDKTHAVRIA